MTKSRIHDYFYLEPPISVETLFTFAYHQHLQKRGIFPCSRRRDTNKEDTPYFQERAKEAEEAAKSKEQKEVSTNEMHFRYSRTLIDHQQ